MNRILLKMFHLNQGVAKNTLVHHSGGVLLVCFKSCHGKQLAQYLVLLASVMIHLNILAKVQRFCVKNWQLIVLIIQIQRFLRSLLFMNKKVNEKHLTYFIVWYNAPHPCLHTIDIQYIFAHLNAIYLTINRKKQGVAKKALVCHSYALVLGPTVLYQVTANDLHI